MLHCIATYLIVNWWQYNTVVLDIMNTTKYLILKHLIIHKKGL